MQFDFSAFIQGKTSEVVFLWKYISIIYIYIFCKSHKVREAQLVRKEYLQKGSGSSLSCHVDQVCSCCCWVLAGEKKKKKKKDAFTKDKVKKRALFFSLLLSLLPCSPPPALPACCGAPAALQQRSASCRVLGVVGKQNQWPGCFVATATKSNPHSSVWLPVGGRSETSTDAAVLQKDEC